MATDVQRRHRAGGEPDRTSGHPIHEAWRGNRPGSAGRRERCERRLGRRPEAGAVWESPLDARHLPGRRVGRPRHLGPRSPSAPASVLDRVVELQVLDPRAVLIERVRAVGLEDQELTLDDAPVGGDRPAADEVCAVEELVEQDRLGEPVQPLVGVLADRAAVVAKRPDEDVLLRRAQPSSLELLRELLRLLLGALRLVLAVECDEAGDAEPDDDDSDRPSTRSAS